MANINILGKDWTNIVFENRNKSYGAYKLRQDSDKNTFLALIIGLGMIGSVLVISTFYNNYSSIPFTTEVPDNTGTIVTDVVFQPKKAPETALTEDNKDKTLGGSAAASVVQEKSLTDVVVKEDVNVSRQVTTAQDDFNDRITSGVKDRQANSNGQLHTDGTQTGDAEVNQGGTGSGTEVGPGATDTSANKIHNFVQVKAEPIEGKEAFYARYINKFKATDVTGSATQIKVTLKFVVEKDGSFSNIQVINDQNGVGQEAVRVLKTMPKWKPAEQNGKAVRSTFTLPITLKVAN